MEGKRNEVSGLSLIQLTANSDIASGRINPGPGASNGKKIKQTNMSRGFAKPSENVDGGDFSQYVCNVNIDNTTGTKVKMLGGGYIPAIKMYQFRIEIDPTVQNRMGQAIVQEIAKLLSKHGWVLWALHIRFHWTTVLVEGSDLDSASITVYDSCPCELHKKDVFKIFNLLKLKKPEYMCLRRQPVNSDECGLHPLLIALVRQYLTLRRSQDKKQVLGQVDLSQWRKILLSLPDGPIQWTAAMDKRFLDAVPELANRYKIEVFCGVCRDGKFGDPTVTCSKCGLTCHKECSKCSYSPYTSTLTGVCTNCIEPPAIPVQQTTSHQMDSNHPTPVTPSGMQPHTEGGCERSKK